MPPISPMQTVSLMSGTSQPIPAHFVLMRSRHSLKQKVRSSISHRANQPSLQRIHNSFLPVPLVLSPLSFSICEEVKLSRPRASTLSLAHSAIIQMIKLQWLKLRVLSFPSFIVLPRMSAVSLRSTKICTFMFASLSDSSGRIQAMHLSTFLMRTSETQIITSNHNTYQMSTLL